MQARQIVSKVISKLFLSYPKVVTGFDCLQAWLSPSCSNIFPNLPRGLVVCKQGGLSQGCFPVFQSYPKIATGIGCLQARQIVSRLFPSSSKAIPKLADCVKVVSKLFQRYPKVVRGLVVCKQGCLQAVPICSQTCHGVWLFVRQIVSRLFPSFPKLSQSCHGVWLFASKTGCLEPHKPPDPGEHESPPPPTLNTLC